MPVVVNDDMNLDYALRMLGREANREKLFDVINKNRYRIKEAQKRHESRKKWAKMKRRRRAASRKLRRKGIGI